MNNLEKKTLLMKIQKVKPKILVFGDIMLDHYVFGEVERISPEAPVPILRFKNEHQVLGGAGNVAHNLVNLGAEVHMATIIGKDKEGESILELLEKIEISSENTFQTKNIDTTKKTRYLSNGFQLLRLDNDSRGFLKEDFDLFKNLINDDINSFDCVIISDYDKGVCSETNVQGIIRKANKQKIPIFVDPKGSNWKKYSGSTCITPNIKEIQRVLNLKLRTDFDFERGAREIIQSFKLKSCLITKGANGMTYYNENESIHKDVSKKEVFDVSGAGDTVIACLAASSISGLSLDDSLSLSSEISSEVVTHVGTTPFNADSLN